MNWGLLRTPGAGFGENHKLQWTPHTTCSGLLVSGSENHLPVILLLLSVNVPELVWLV